MRQGAKERHENQCQSFLREEKNNDEGERVQGGAQALRGVLRVWDGGSGEGQMQQGKDAERSYKTAQRHSWAREHTRVLTSTWTFPMTSH